MTPRFRWALAVLALLLGAYAFRIAGLNADAIWHDEAWSIRAFRGPFTTPDDNTPHLYYIAGHLLWRAGGGESPFALRYVSALLGLLTVALSLRVGVRWFGRVWGWLGGFLIALSPLLWAYGQEVRAYVAVPLIALGLLAVADAILARRRGESVPRRLWLAAFAVAVAGLYTHNLSVPLIVWLNVALGMAWLWRRDWQKMVAWAGVMAAVSVAYIPWLLTQSPSGTPLNTPPPVGLALIRDIWASYFFPVNQQLADITAAEGFTALTVILSAGVALLIAALWWAIRSGRRRAWLLLSHALLVPAFSIALMLAARIDFHPRYMIGGVAGALLLAVGAAQYIARDRRYAQAGLYALIALFAVWITALSWHQINTRSAYRHDDFRGLAEYYATLPADAVIVIPFNAERALQDYYADALNIRAGFVNVPLYADEQTATATINALIGDEPRHVEFLTWFQLPADVRGMYPCLLAGASRHIEPPRTFAGLATQAFTLDRPLTFTPLNDAPRFAGIDHISGAYVRTPDGACLRTGWANPPAGDFSVNAALLNPFGGEITRADAPITRDDNAPTSAWGDTDTGTAYALLTLPDGAPERAYTLTFGVYSAESPSGLDRLDAAGNPAGKLARFESAILTAGGVSDRRESAWLDDNALDGERLATGRPLDVTAYILPDDAPLTLRGDGWELTAGGDGLTWARFIVPAGNAGDAVLLAGARELRRYTVIDVPRIFETPPAEIALDVEFVGVGHLVGANADGDSVTLVWRGSGDVATAYTVFVQRIGADGRVIAQSDSQPANGGRPTTGWIDGEYIIDTHMLNGADADDDSRLIVGLYDPADFARVRTGDGDDFAVIR